MATTLQTRISDLIGTISDLDAVKDAIRQGCRVLIDMMPEHILEQHSTIATVTTDGYAVGNYRIHSANKGGYDARRVPASLRKLVQDPGSIHYAVSTNPVMLVYSSKIYIYPGGGTLLKVDYPAITSVTDTDITGIQDHLEQIPVTYAAIQLLNHQIQDVYAALVTSIGSLTTSAPTAPATVSAPSFSYTELDNTLTVTATPPTFTKPTFGGDFSTLDTPLDTEQDVELTEGHILRIREYLNKFRQDLDAEIGEFNKEVEIYRQNINYTIEATKLILERDITNQQTELKEQIEEYKATLEKYAADIQKYAAEVNAYATGIRAELELNAVTLSKFKAKMELIPTLQSQYKHLVNVHLGVEV